MFVAIFKGVTHVVYFAWSKAIKNIGKSYTWGLYSTHTHIKGTQRR